jgi:hypothetical protein
MVALRQQLHNLVPGEHVHQELADGRAPFPRVERSRRFRQAVDDDRLARQGVLGLRHQKRCSRAACEVALFSTLNNCTTSAQNWHVGGFDLTPRFALDCRKAGAPQNDQGPQTPIDN